MYWSGDKLWEGCEDVCVEGVWRGVEVWRQCGGGVEAVWRGFGVWRREWGVMLHNIPSTGRIHQKMLTV